MKVHEVMSRRFVTIQPQATWKEAAELLLREHLSCAFVVDSESGKLLGILSEKDLFRGLFPTFSEWEQDASRAFSMTEASSHATHTTASDLMATRLIVANPDTHVLHVGGRMLASGIHHIPVVDSEHRIVGCVGRGDIYRAILKAYYNV